MERPPTTAERQWLDYLRDLGFEHLYLPRASPSAAEPRPDEAGRRAAPLGDVGPSSSAPRKEEGSERGALEAVARAAAGCTACKLAAGRRNVVFGSGNPEASLMLIGEGPGAAEDLVDAYGLNTIIATPLRSLREAPGPVNSHFA